jgi:hypothetical protein
MKSDDFLIDRFALAERETINQEVIFTIRLTYFS